MKNSKYKTRGATFVELLCAVAILAILFSLTAGTITRAAARIHRQLAFTEMWVNTRIDRASNGDFTTLNTSLELKWIQ